MAAATRFSGLASCTIAAIIFHPSKFLFAERDSPGVVLFTAYPL